MLDIGSLGGVSLVTPPPLKPTDGVAGLWLMSDLHIGAANVGYPRIRREIRAAVKRGDRILVNGDVFDAIVAGDPRYRPSVLHPSLQESDTPLDGAVEMAAELLAPAVSAGLLDYIGRGNHEATIEARAGLSLIDTLRGKLLRWGNVPPAAGYCGFITYRIRGGGRLVIFAHHGSKSGRGRTQLARFAGFVGADVVWLGHFHQKDSSGGLVVTPSADGKRIDVREQRHVMTGGYTFAYGSSDRGVIDRYASVAGLSPGLLGGARLVVSVAKSTVSVEVCS
jgi:hypothetical protein